MGMISWKPTRQWLAFAALLVVGLPAHKSTNGQATGVSAPVPCVLYVPAEADSRAEFNRDRANQKVQNWHQYWEWVQTFYNGNFLSEGWTKFSQVTLDAVKSEPARLTLLKSLNELGKAISREWAKDASLRKINTVDLRRWYAMIVAARRDDGGSGQSLLDALQTIREQVEKLEAR